MQKPQACGKEGGAMNHPLLHVQGSQVRAKVKGCLGCRGEPCRAPGSSRGRRGPQQAMQGYQTDVERWQPQAGNPGGKGKAGCRAPGLNMRQLEESRSRLENQKCKPQVAQSWPHTPEAGGPGGPPLSKSCFGPACLAWPLLSGGADRCPVLGSFLGT